MTSNKELSAYYSSRPKQENLIIYIIYFMCETRSHSDLEINEGVMKFVGLLIRLFVAICITDITLNWFRISKVIRSGKFTLKNLRLLQNGYYIFKFW